MAFFIEIMQLSKSKNVNNALNKINVHSYVDVLLYLPYKYDDLSLTKENNLKDKERVVILGKIASNFTVQKFKNITLTRFFFTSKNGNTFFIKAYNRPYLNKIFSLDEVVTLIGTYDSKNNVINLSSLYKGNKANQIKPIYHLPSSLENHVFYNLVHRAFEAIKNNDIIDIIPQEFKDKYHLLNKIDALKMLHYPTSFKQIQFALRTIKYEECLLFSLQNQIIRNQNKKSYIYKRNLIKNNDINKFIASLPFTLTQDQKEVAVEILHDMNQSELMYRLLQGDVGSGKTVVAIIALYANYIRGEQGALMAPTDALARQHAETLNKLLKPFNIKIALLLGSASMQERSIIRQGLINKNIDIVVGTHILFSKDISYLDLGLVVIDEQHKFGVNQRFLLSQKSEHADILQMSATPIPRSLALTLYGDMDVSTISSFPTKNKDVTTKLIHDENEIFHAIDETLKNKQKIYIIAPKIDDELSNKASVEALFKVYSNLYPGLVSLLHGKLSEDDKNYALRNFRLGITPILVSTTVIEVGIDIKDATLMVIYNASNFGLAQLHQLRGRIGRNEFKNYCLLYDESEDEEVLERLNVLVNSNDGFYISEKDLSLRGAGELLGNKQSGITPFSYVNIIDDFKMLQVSLSDAKYIIENASYPDFKKIIVKASTIIDENKKI